MVADMSDSIVKPAGAGVDVRKSKGLVVPSLVQDAGPEAVERFLEYFVLTL